MSLSDRRQALVHRLTDRGHFTPIQDGAYCLGVTDGDMPVMSAARHDEAHPQGTTVVDEAVVQAMRHELKRLGLKPPMLVFGTRGPIDRSWMARVKTWIRNWMGTNPVILRPLNAVEELDLLGPVPTNDTAELRRRLGVLAKALSPVAVAKRVERRVEFDYDWATTTLKATLQALGNEPVGAELTSMLSEAPKTKAWEALELASHPGITLDDIVEEQYERAVAARGEAFDAWRPGTMSELMAMVRALVMVGDDWTLLELLLRRGGSHVSADLVALIVDQAGDKYIPTLKALGANLNLEHEGLRPIERALLKGHTVVAAELVDAGAQLDGRVLKFAATHANGADVLLLAGRKHINLNTVVEGKPLIVHAAEAGQVHNVATLALVKVYVPDDLLARVPFEVRQQMKEAIGQRHLTAAEQAQRAKQQKWARRAGRPLLAPVPQAPLSRPSADGLGID